MKNKLPAVIVAGKIVLPGNVFELKGTKIEIQEAIKEAIEKNNNELIFITSSSPLKGKEGPEYPGILIRVLKQGESDGRGLYVVLESLKRVRCNKPTSKDINVEYHVPTEINSNPKITKEVRKLMESILRSKFDYDDKNIEIESVISGTNDSEFYDKAANALEFPLSVKKKLVKALDISERAELSLAHFADNVKATTKDIDQTINGSKGDKPIEQEMDEKVQGRVNDKVRKQQKEFYLREQMRAIKQELNELNGEEDEIGQLRKKVEENPYPQHIKDKLLVEIRRLELTPSQAQEANITRQYIETLLELPY